MLGKLIRTPDPSIREYEARTATDFDGGWVDKAEPIIVQAGEGLIVVPVEDHS